MLTNKMMNLGRRLASSRRAINLRTISRVEGC